MNDVKNRWPQIAAAALLSGLLAVAFVVTTGMPDFGRGDGQAERLEEQDQWQSHDPSESFGYGYNYVGAAPNTVALMSSMPVGSSIQTTQISTTDVTFTVERQELDEAQFRQNMTYSAVGFLTLIDNASSVTFDTPDGAYSFAREDVVDALGFSLDRSRARSMWEDMRHEVPRLADELIPAL